MFQGLSSLKDSLFKNKILVENFTFLSVSQLANLLLFIITIPYLFRVLGSKYYGLIIFAQTLVFYFSIFINFGFNLTATRDVSVNRNNPAKLNEIFSAVLTLKFLLFIVSMGLMIFISFLVPALREHQKLYIFSMLAGLSEALFPLWYFQGSEKMKYITLINVSTRVLATLSVFIIITGPSDYFLYPVIVGAGTVSGALIAIYFVTAKHRIIFSFLSPGILLSYFRENFLFFVSNVSTQLYINANKLFIGAFLGMIELAYYDLAEKVVNIAKVPLSLLGQTLFPRVARDRNIKFLKKMMFYTVIFAAVMVTTIFLFSDRIIELLSGIVTKESVEVLRILTLSLIPISISLFYGDLLLINFGLKIQYAKMRFFGLISYLTLFTALYFSKNLGIQQLAILVVFVESFMTFYSLLLAKRNSII